MLWLMESPWTIGLTGGFFAGLCIFAWFQNGRKQLVMAFFGVIAATLAFLALERWWVTETEEIKSTIRQIARDVESNDFNRMAAHFHPSASEIREAARSEVGNYDFKSISVKDNFEVKLNLNHRPQKAEVGFNAVAVVTVHSLGAQDMTVARYVEFLMYKDSADGKWKVAGYGHRSAIPGQAAQFDRPLQTE
jgi:hypothetical protein